MPFVLVVPLSILQSKHPPAGSQHRGGQLHSWEPPQSAVFPLKLSPLPDKTVAYNKGKKTNQALRQIHIVSFSIFPVATWSEASVKDLSQTPQPKCCDFSIFPFKTENWSSHLPFWNVPVFPLHVQKSKCAAARSFSCEWGSAGAGQDVSSDSIRAVSAAKLRNKWKCWLSLQHVQLTDVRACKLPLYQWKKLNIHLWSLPRI